jgi:hypothetical protein
MISHRVAALLLCALPLLGGCFLFPPDTDEPSCTISRRSTTPSTSRARS